MRIEINYNLTELRDLAKRFPEVTRKEIHTVLDLIVRRLEKEVVELTPRGVSAEGGLAGGVFGEVVTLGEQFKGIVGDPVPYGEVIELGRRPGKRRPPVDPLIPWVRSKLGISDDKEARGIAYVIAKRIGASGFKSIPKGAQMFQKAWDKNQSWVQGQLRTLPGRIIAKVTGK